MSIMQVKEIDKDIYDYSAYLDEQFGAIGTPQRAAVVEKAWEDYNAQILYEARKQAGITQSELAARVGKDKGYISRIERGLIVPSVSTLYKLAAAMGFSVELRPI